MRLFPMPVSFPEQKSIQYGLACKHRLNIDFSQLFMLVWYFACIIHRGILCKNIETWMHLKGTQS